MSYNFAEQPSEELVELIPCFAGMYFPGYDTTVLHRVLDGREVIIQLWKGYCPSYLPGMIGGIGAEVGIYQNTPFPFWFPDHRHKKKISFSLIHPHSGQVFFTADEKTCWWRHKWMTELSYSDYCRNHTDVPPFPNQYILDFKIVGRQNTIHERWVSYSGSPTFYIKAKHSGKVLDVDLGFMNVQGSDLGQNLQQWDKSPWDNQKFIFAQQSNGFYKIIAKHSNKVLDVRGASLENGAHIIQWNSHGGDNQLFEIRHIDKTYYKIIAKHSGKVFDVWGGSRDNGATIRQYRSHGQDNQLFSFSPA